MEQEEKKSSTLTGVDLSQEMLEKLLQKWPAFFWKMAYPLLVNLL